MNAVIIDIQNLHKIYKLSEEISVHALQGINFKVRRGEFVAIMGASGSGKSTFMNVIGFLDTPTSGRYILDGIDGTSLNENQKAEIRNRKIGFVFQGFNLLSRTPAIENVEMPLFYRGGFSHEEMRERAGKFLAMVGLSGRETHHPNTLSGGEQQRVAIARALVNDPAILLADEPTGNLDSKNTSEIMNIFTYLNKEYNLSIVMVTHEPDVAEYSDRKVIFKDGLIIDEVIIKKLKKRKK